MTANVDLAVIGAGPAGLAAGVEAGSLGLSTLVLDENARPGGQIWRAVERPGLPAKAVFGDDYARGGRLAAAFRASPIDYRAGATVWSLSGDRLIQYSRAGRAEVVTAGAAIVATGALERPMPFPGWTLPGVMTCGAAQTAMKASGLVPDGRVVLAGTGPLLWLLAAQIQRAGGNVAAILDTTPTGAMRRAWRGAGDFLRSPYALKGLRLLAEVRARTRVISRVIALEAQGERFLEGVAYRRGGVKTVIAADLLLVHQGVAPNLNLPLAAGCAIEWREASLDFRPRRDAWGFTSLDGVAVAGDGGGIGGVLVAEREGRLAALDAARRLGRLTLADRDARALPIKAELARARRGRGFLDALYRPGDAFRLPADEVIVCRCEEVTAGAVRAAARGGATGPNQAKAFLRCGMGPCQGRYCGLTVSELIARETGRPPGEVGYYRIRSPVKPVTLGELAALDGADDIAPPE